MSPAYLQRLCTLCPTSGRDCGNINIYIVVAWNESRLKNESKGAVGFFYCDEIGEIALRRYVGKVWEEGEFVRFKFAFESKGMLRVKLGVHL